MSRVLRIEFEGALYHVSCRGNNGADIFFGDEGREKWLDTLDECCVRSGWVVHAYVLMGNHYHLLLETPEGNLVDGMKWLQGTYTQRINAWRKRRGHLFQGRYKAQLVNSEQRGGNYLQVASDYIHLNPARAGLVGDHGEWRKLADYPWSSLPLYLGWKRKRPEWLETGKVLGSLNLKDGTAGRESYGRYLEARVLEERAGREEAGKAYAELRRGWCLGDGDFRRRMLDLAEKLMEGRKKESHGGGAKREHGEKAAGEWLEEGLGKLGLSKGDLGGMKKLAPEKKALAGWLAMKTLARTEWIAGKLVMGDRSHVSRAKRWLGETAEGKKWLSRLE